MLEELIYGFIDIRAKPPEESSIGVNRAKEVSNLLLSRNEAGKRELNGTLLNRRIISHDIPRLPFTC